VKISIKAHAASNDPACEILRQAFEKAFFLRPSAADL